MIHCKKEDFDVMSGAFLLWFVVEIISFTPNTYDNNKSGIIGYYLSAQGQNGRKGAKKYHADHAEVS